MLKILNWERKTATASIADRSTRSESFDDEYDVVVVDELSEAWEFINPSSSDGDEEADVDNLSFTEEEQNDTTTDEVSASSGPNKEEFGPIEFGSPSSDISMETESLPVPAHFDHNPLSDFHHENNYDDEYEDENDDDLDDELVPWGLGDKLGRQRLRKLGKRAGPKMNKAKKLAYMYNRPGCVHGKHGFGVQRYYI
ncbi:hypothetical protein ACH5RR_022025 [Cinchona calisaya]|uniref:Uncharacterized protein n=1 Tax=Cinchona calisaya TaxID=153742 RepID=A0ABD2Z7P8_9GENT